MAKCPHCKQRVELDPKRADGNAKLVRRDVVGVLKKEVMYSCPHCECVIGFCFFVGLGFHSRR